MALTSATLPTAALPALGDPLVAALTLVAIIVTSVAIRRLVLHPLSGLPGPLDLRLTSLPLLWRSYVGNEATYLTALFHRYDSPILRIGPDEVLIADGSVLAPIYSTNGGFAKAPCYRNFDIDGFASLFSALDKNHRAPRAKSVLPLFSTGQLRREEEKVKGVTKALVQWLQMEKAKGGRVDVLDPARRTAVDVVSTCLFGTSYGGLSPEKLVAGNGEDGAEEKLSASEFVNAFVGVGRFFFLPTWAFLLLEKVATYLFETEETTKSFESVQAFVERLVREADLEDGTYQARMLKLGLSREEVAAQLKDLVFAGTDSSGMNLSTFCWQMAKHPESYAKLKAEVQNATAANPDVDVSTLPYFRACIKETLRLSMANPTRFPRVVPPGGWTYTPSADFSLSATAGLAHHQAKQSSQPQPQPRSYFLPAGTLVSVQINTLHHNPAVFPEPREFKPERWLESPPELLDKMNRDHIPFLLGSRQCIARNLAMMELNTACAAIVQSGNLDGARNVGDRIEIFEWFNSKVRGERIEIEYATA